MEYQRFYRYRNFCQRVRDYLPGMGSGILGLALVCALCVGLWWDFSEASAGAWEDYNPNIWETSNLKNLEQKMSPTTIEKEQQLDDCKAIPDNMRFDCAPNGNQTVCEKRGCCWKEPDTKGAPSCYYPAGYDTFHFVNKTESKQGIRVTYKRGRASGYPGDFANVVIDFKYLSDDTLQFKIYDADHKRFEPPIPEIPDVVGPTSNLQYRVQVDSGNAGFKIIRNSDNVTIINTQDIGAMILSDQFLQISTLLPTDRIFGFGENMDHLKKDINWKTYTLFNRDQGTKLNTNLYGTHPFYLGVEKNGKSHGMFLLNTNAIDVVLQPTPALTYRTIGGVLNFMLFVGPTPQQVLSQYTAVIGRPHMPPYWALGFHLCRFGYNTLNRTRHAWKTNREAGIPFDVQWNDIDYMDRKNDFSYDQTRFKGLPEFVKELHDAGMHYVMIFDPGQPENEPRGKYPPYDRGVDMNVFVKNSKDKPFIGSVWNPTTVFPDFSHPNATSYWTEMMTAFHKKVNFDGAWNDMNEPSNWKNIDNCGPLQLPYKPHWAADIEYTTLCMDAKHHLGKSYDVHNLYSLYEAISTYHALKEIRGKRPFIITRSTFPGSGRYAGHWSGDNGSWWQHLRYSIYDILNFSLFGIPLVGADICGFGHDTTVELCKRWMQLGAFYPFSRNHNYEESIDQDPVSLGPVVVEASITALRLRYRLLPYYYTLFWEAHTKGHTVATPVFFLSPNDPELDKIEHQFLIGHHVLISPIVEEHANTTRAFFPGPNKWYNIVTGDYLASNQYLNITDTDMVSVQGGAILPLQEPAPSGPVTTTNTRTRPLQLLAVPDHANTAAGQLYWDDGDSNDSLEAKKYSHIEFTLKGEVLSSKVVYWGYSAPTVDKITVLGLTSPVKNVTLNDTAVKFEYDTKYKLLNLNVTLALDKPFTVKWTY